MFDAIIREISQRFGLGDQAEEFTTWLVGLIFDPNRGGISGLLAKFRERGLADPFLSWLGGSAGQPTAVTPQQIDDVFGSSALDAIADKLGMPRANVTAAAAAALPKIIGMLTPNGQLPTSIPPAVSDLLDLPGTSSAATAARPGRTTAPTVVTVPADAASASRGGGIGWLKWLALAVIILALGYCVLNRQPAPIHNSPAASTPAPAPN